MCLFYLPKNIFHGVEKLAHHNFWSSSIFPKYFKPLFFLKMSGTLSLSLSSSKILKMLECMCRKLCFNFVLFLLQVHIVDDDLSFKRTGIDNEFFWSIVKYSPPAFKALQELHIVIWDPGFLLVWIMSFYFLWAWNYRVAYCHTHRYDPAVD